jgi:hypothetical protein
MAPMKTLADAPHDHTTADGTGVLTNDEHDGYQEIAEIAAPSTPAANKARLYAKDKAGTTELFYKNDAGTERDLSASGASGGTPALTLGTANTPGAAATFIRDDDTILTFDATVPVTQAFADAAAVGAATVAARRDHKHGMPATPALDPHGFAAHTGAIDPVATIRWQPRVDGAAAATTGTGTTSTIASSAIFQNATGATSGGTAKTRSFHGSSAGGANGVARLRRGQVELHAFQNTAQRIYMYFTNENPAGEPSNTARHIGIRVTDGTTYFSTADNTTEQTTDISAFLTLTNTLNAFVFTFDGTTAKCYVNGTLAATHATNVPGTASGVSIDFCGYIVSTESVSKTIEYGDWAAEIAPL